MTLTVNGQPAVPGCVVDGHWGQYGGVHLLSRAEEFDVEHDTDFCRRLAEIYTAWPKNDDGELVGAYGSDRDADEGKATGPFAALVEVGDTDGQDAMELADKVLELLNSVTEGGYWEWWEGECFLRSYVCQECHRDARTGVIRHSKHCGECGMLTYAEYTENAPPCDFCCDADDPGCFA